MPPPPNVAADLLDKAKTALRYMRQSIEGAIPRLAGEATNVAYMDAWWGEQPMWRRYAFSSWSQLPLGLKRVLAPPVPADWFGRVAIHRNFQCANHTEPKLFLAFRLDRHGNEFQFNKIHLASERDCCRTCLSDTVRAVMAIQALRELAGGANCPFIVIEAWSDRVAYAHEILG